MNKYLWIILSICLVCLLSGCGKTNAAWNKEAERVFKELAQQKDATLIDALAVIDVYERQMTQDKNPTSKESIEKFRLYMWAQKYVNNKILAIAPEYRDKTKKDKDNPEVEFKLYMRIMRLCGLSMYQFKD